ncbi:hypothetical protein EBB07_33175 [Paenibacillaceae bacterium]|nr:hypothetical protein EBB07_33175 [Paenibacillaceae bacterium]
MGEPVTAISESLYDRLQTEAFVLLHTIDAEHESPTSSAISWVYAPDPQRLRIAIDGRSRIVANLTARSDVCVTVFAAGSVQAVYGQAALVTDQLNNVPFNIVCFDIHISALRDAMFYGARLAALPEYENTYDKRAAEKLDGQVFDAMKKA